MQRSLLEDMLFQTIAHVEQIVHLWLKPKPAEISCI
jgi:hypothetical protein